MTRVRSSLLLVVAALVCVLFATVSTSGGVDLWQAPEWEPAPIDRTPIEIDSEPIEFEAPPPPQGDDGSTDLPRWLVVVLQVIAVGLAAALAVALLLTAWQRRPRLRWRRRSGNVAFDALPDVAATVVARAGAQRAALLEGAPRNAIVQCWRRLELDVAEAGLRRDPADTSLEFTERVLARYSVDPGAIHELAARYREARFSDHDLVEADREAALAALDRLHRTLADTGSDTGSNTALGASDPTVGASR